MTVTATVKIGGKSYKVTIKAKVPQGKTVTLSTEVSGALAKALAAGDEGTLTATTTVVDAAGKKHTKDTKATIELG